MKIPQRFVEAFQEKCPTGVWRFTVYAKDTQEAQNYSYSLTQAWELIDNLATSDRPRAIEILEFFGFVMPAKPKLKLVQEGEEDDHAANRFAQVEMD